MGLLLYKSWHHTYKTKNKKQNKNSIAVSLILSLGSYETFKQDVTFSIGRKLSQDAAAATAHCVVIGWGPETFWT